jgi:hypothetical protein
MGGRGAKGGATLDQAVLHQVVVLDRAVRLAQDLKDPLAVGVAEAVARPGGSPGRR